ncbi:glycosyltransferase family 2 protein [Maricaulaceae bacterium MS644]
MSAPASIAVLIVAYRSRNTIPQVIAALKRQSVQAARVRVLENGSPEPERVDAAGLPDFVELVLSETNLGFAAGNNRLAKGVEEDWLLLLNPDAFPEADMIEQLLAAAARHPGAALFGATQLAHGAPGVLDGAGDVYHFTGLPYRGGYGLAIDPPEEGEVFGPCGALTLVRREVFEALGGFDEDYFCYVEDVDLAYRARLAGHHAIQVRDARVSHMGYASSGRRSEFATYHGARNRFWTFFKNTPAPLLPLLAPVHLGVTLLLWLSAARFGQFTLFGKAMADALKGWPRLMEKRRAVQAGRTLSALETARLFTWTPQTLVTRAPDVRPVQDTRP